MSYPSVPVPVIPPYCLVDWGPNFLEEPASTFTVDRP